MYLDHAASTVVARGFERLARSSEDLAVMIRERSSRLAASGYKCFVGALAPSAPQRNRHQGSLNAEKMLMLLVRLDRVVSGGRIDIFDLENVIDSELMFGSGVQIRLIWDPPRAKLALRGPC